MRISTLLIAAASLLGAPSAFAQEGEKASDKGFTGFRAEATIGYDQTSDHVVGDTLRGMRVGGAVGYDLSIGETFTIGAEAGIGWTVAGNKSVVFSGPADEAYSYRASAAHDADVSVRLGAKLGKNTLVFAKAGWADLAYRYNLTSPNRETVYGHSDGIRLGLGLEQKLGGHLYAKAEYRYTRFDEYGSPDPDRHQLLTGLGVRF